MDNERINNDVEVLDFFDDDEETTPVEPAYVDPTPEIAPVMPETPAEVPVEPTYVDATPEIAPVIPEAPVEVPVEIPTEAAPETPAPEVPVEPTYVDATPEIAPVIPEAPVEVPAEPAYVDATPEIAPVMPEAPVEVPAEPTETPTPEVPTFTGFEGVSVETAKPTEQPEVVNSNNLNYSAFDVEDKYAEPVVTNTEMPKIEPKEIVTTEKEKEILKDVEASTPTSMNDQLLKLEDTLTKNTLKEDIKKEERKEEAKSNKRAVTFIVTIFVILGLLILFLPSIIKLF